MLMLHFVVTRAPSFNGFHSAVSSLFVDADITD